MVAQGQHHEKKATFQEGCVPGLPLSPLAITQDASQLISVASDACRLRSSSLPLPNSVPLPSLRNTELLALNFGRHACYMVKDGDPAMRVLFLEHVGRLDGDLPNIAIGARPAINADPITRAGHVSVLIM
jgi:hypothetical protein